MKRLSIIIVSILFAVLLGATHTFAQRKLAQTGMKFLQIGVSAKGAALAEAMTALEGNSLSMFYNPASMARQTTLVDVNLGQVEWIADINQVNGAVSFSPADGDYGVFGVSFISMDYGELIQTILAGNDQRFLEIGTFKPTATALGIGYARALTDKFSVGGHLRFVNQDLGSGLTKVSYIKGANGQDSSYSIVEQVDNKMSINSFDFGILYHTGWKSLTFGMNLRNFSEEVKYVEDRFQLPLTFQIGLSMDMMDLMEGMKGLHSFTVSAVAEHPRDFTEQVRIGAEYTFMNMLSARVGYVSPADEHSLSYGLGLNADLAGVLFGVDFAYTPFGVFNSVSRLNLHFGF